MRPLGRLALIGEEQRMAPSKKKPLVFATVGRAVFEYWPARNGRWHWHRRVHGDVTEYGSYASRRSCRRKLHQVVAKEGK